MKQYVKLGLFLSSSFIILFCYFNKITFLATIPAVQIYEIGKERPYNNIGMKYILKWPDANLIPAVFKYLGNGQEVFVKKKCPYTNCFVTTDKNFLGDYTKFDVILFSGFPESNLLPKKRSPHQIYAFATMESADRFPICNDKFNDFFNWTLTYKLNSDVRWVYIAIWDKKNNVIGPNEEMHWMKVEDMKPVTDELKDKLKKKTKTAAWFVSKCKTRGKREDYMKQLQEELKPFDLTVDVYGECGNLKCPRNNHTMCDKMVEAEYHFYFALENSFAEDYISEKLLIALMNKAIPVVWGGSNYTRFMAEGTYLNARKLSPKELARTMNEIMQHPEVFYDYFRWHNHYSYDYSDGTVHTNKKCALCAMLNNKQFVNKRSSYKNFKDWWTPTGRC